MNTHEPQARCTTSEEETEQIMKTNGIDRMDKVSHLFLENADHAREAYQLIQDKKIDIISM